MAGLRASGLVAPFVLDGPINRDACETYITRVLVSDLRPGDAAVMDNLSSHKGSREREMIEAAGVTLLYLPLYSPGCNPIKIAFATLKAQSPSAQAGLANRQSSQDNYRPTRRCLYTRECRHYLAAAAYDGHVRGFGSERPDPSGPPFVSFLPFLRPTWITQKVIVPCRPLTTVINSNSGRT